MDSRIKRGSFVEVLDREYVRNSGWMRAEITGVNGDIFQATIDLGGVFSLTLKLNVADESPGGFGDNDKRMHVWRKF